MYPITVEKTSLDKVLLIKKPDWFKDFRGEYFETYNEKRYKEAGITMDFMQDDISVSKKNVLRGIHGDQKTWKLVSCLVGEFYFVAVNWDEASPQYGRWVSFILSEKNRWQVLVPPKFGNGHLVLSEQAMYQYKQSTEYDRAGQFTILWNDPRLNIPWPVKNPILSERDGGAKRGK